MKKTREFTLPDGDWVLYVLKCQHHIHYVGVSTNLGHRLNQHANGKGAHITKAHKPIKLVGVYSIGYMSYEEAEKYEDAFTLRNIVEHNSSKWRGGRYCGKCNPKIAKKKLAAIDKNYLSELPRVEFDYIFSEKLDIPRKKKPKGNPWAKQMRKARGQLRMSSKNRFGIQV